MRALICGRNENIIEIDKKAGEKKI